MTARATLLRFLDEKAFDPVLNARPDDYPTEAERQALSEAQQATRREQQRYHDEYRSAEEIRDNFLEDVSADAARRLDSELGRLRLPRLPDLKELFLKLCDELGL